MGFTCFGVIIGPLKESMNYDVPFPCFILSLLFCMLHYHCLYQVFVLFCAFMDFFPHAWLSSLVVGSGSEGFRDSESVSATTFTILDAASVTMAEMSTAGAAAEADECPLSNSLFSILFTCSQHVFHTTTLPSY